jgi:DNA-binding XRE family transcriptional regulator
VSVVSPSASVAERFVLLMRRTYPSSSEISLSVSSRSSWGRDGGGGRSGTLDPEMVARAEALASWIRGHREAFACSQQEFAEESGISRATLSKIEQGRIYPSMQVRRKLAKALGVGPQELWNLRSEVEESTKQAS